MKRINILHIYYFSCFILSVQISLFPFSFDMMLNIREYNIQTGPNHLNHYYRWPAVVVIQMVWPGLYTYTVFTGDLQIQSMMTEIPFFSKTTLHIIIHSAAK